MSPQVNRTAGVKLSRQWLNFTEHQDLQLSLGLDLDWAGTARQAAGSSSSRALGGVKPVGGWRRDCCEEPYPQHKQTEGGWGMCMRCACYPWISRESAVMA